MSLKQYRNYKQISVNQTSQSQVSLSKSVCVYVLASFSWANNSPFHYAHFLSCVAFPLIICSPPFWHEQLKAFLQFLLNSIQLCLNSREMHLDLIVGGVENLFKSGNMHMQIFKQDTQLVILMARLFLLSASRLQFRRNGRSSLDMLRCS